MKDIEDRLRDMADKWRDANRDVFDVCRDGAEEIRVLRAHLDREKNSNFTLGWGKGKDE